MHRMTRDAATAKIMAPFAQDSFAFRGDEARMLAVDGRRYVKLTSKYEGTRLYRVTKVIGGRYREDYAGVEVSGLETDAVVRSDEYVLPVSYLLFAGEYRYKGYSVMTPERPGLRRGARWRTTCIFCHNTVPYFSTLFDELRGSGAAVYQGSVSVELPAERRFKFEITDQASLARALDAELARLGVPPLDADSKIHARLDSAIGATRRRFGEQHLVELGIGCEACHGGARAHAADPARVAPMFALASDFVRVRAAPGTPTHAQDINRTCAKCHTVLFSRYPHTWEGRSRSAAPGGSHINSGEARDFLLGGCSEKLACTRCHDPHAEDSRAELAALEGERGDALCIECHERLRPASARRAHTRHEPNSAGSRCIACHMSKKNMALDYELTRYHRIGSPTDRERVEGDRPLECALCHADKSVAELVSAMEARYGKRFDRRALRRLYGADLRRSAIVATLEHGKPHEQAVAAHVAGGARLAEALPALVGVLGTDYPLVRFYALRALESITGEKPPLDPNAPGPELVASGRRWLRARP
jgi:predicted CXXCH cytochrome family protein